MAGRIVVTEASTGDCGEGCMRAHYAATSAFVGLWAPSQRS